MKRKIPIIKNRLFGNGASRSPTVSLLLLTIYALWLPVKAFGVGSWTNLTSQPADNIGICLLLSDGTVLAEGSGSNWWALTPDSTGHYVNGNWSARNSSSWGHQDGSTAVLKSGNVFVAGGENGDGTNQVEIFHPVTGSWSVAINGTYFGNIYDGNASLMPDGRVLIEPQNTFPSYRGLTFLFDPSSNTFSQTTGAPQHYIREATWVKLPNDDVLLIDSDDSSIGATTAEMYNPNTELWTNAVTGGTVPNIWPDLTGSGIVSEMGPAFLLPNGNAIFFGGNGVTAVYNNGTWSHSATVPDGLGQKDAPGAMMVNGKILLAVSPMGDNSSKADGNGIGPTSFYEYDYTANGGAGGFTLAPSPGSGISSRAANIKLLDLPDGTVLLSGVGSQLYVYQPDGSPLPAGQPNITKVEWNSDGSLHLAGTLFNGISQGASYGDNEQMDSNYPLVRFSSGGSVHYGYTYNWSSTSVQTGNRIVTTESTVPPVVLDSPGEWTLQVVANGIASPGVSFYGPVWVDFNATIHPGNGTYATPYYTLALGVSAVPTGGTIFIKPGSSSETMTISNSMTLVAVGGPATIGL